MQELGQKGGHLLGAIVASFGYVLIVILSLIGGFVANVSRPDSQATLRLEFGRLIGSSEVLWIVLPVIFLFFVYFTARAMLLDRPGPYPVGAISAWLWTILIVNVLTLAFVGAILAQLGAFSSFFIVLAVTVPPTIMLFLTYWLEHSDHSSEQAHKFLPKIFYPGFSICYLSFCLGWVLRNPQFEGLNAIYIIASLIAVMFLGTFRRSTSVTVIPVLAVLILTIIVLSFTYRGELGLCLLIALLWTFCLGCSEVAKRPYLITAGKAIVASEERESYYIAGANWSSILFLNLLLFLPLLVYNNLMFAIALISWALIFIWHTTHQKESKQAYKRAVAMGYVLPVAIILLMLSSRVTMFDSYVRINTPDPFQTDRLITLVGVFTTIIFVLFPEKLKRLPMDLQSNELFLSRQSCLLFAAGSIAVQTVLATFIFSVSSATNAGALPDFQFRVDLLLMAFVLELVAILVMLLFPGNRKDYEASPKEGNHDNNAPVAPTNEQLNLSGPRSPTVSSVLLNFVWQVGRLPVSVIAGACVSALLATVTELPWTLIIAHALPVTLLTMAGFTLNDIYDVEKDRLAGAEGKPIASGQASMTYALIFSWIWIGGALIMAAPIRTGQSYYIILAALFGVASYSFVAQKAPLFKGAATALLCCTPLAYGAEVANITVPIQIYLLLVVFIFGRELLLDVIDLPGDLRAGFNTLASYLNPHISRAVGWTLMTGSMVVFIAFNRGVPQMIAVAALLSLGVSAWIWFHDETKGVTSTRISLLLVVFATPLSI